MQIDWVTVVAQAVNFLILVWLLHHFLYGPITRAMQRREQRISDSREEAERKVREAADEAEDYRRKQRDLEERRDEIMAEAREEANQLREELKGKVREEMDEAENRWRSQIAGEREEFLRLARTGIADRFVDLARRALGDLADADLEEKVVDVFLERFESLEADSRRDIAGAVTAGGNAVTVRSSFELTPATKRRITGAVRELTDREAEVEYEVTEELTCGVKLEAGGRTVSWGLDSYLDDVERRLGEELAEAASQPAAAQE